MTDFSRCNEVNSTLSDFIEKRLGLLDRLRLRLHLMRCPKCLEYFKQFKRVYENSGKVEQQDLPEDFDQVMNRVIERWKKGD